MRLICKVIIRFLSHKCPESSQPIKDYQIMLKEKTFCNTHTGGSDDVLMLKLKE